jgi:hypothetical protein
MNSKYCMALLGLMAPLIAPLWAHHSTAMFDNTQRITVAATVKKLEWTSPHAWLQILVVNDQGEAEEWGLEMGTPAAMMREGWKPRSVKPGDKVTVVLNPLKNGEHGGNLVSVTKADGALVGKAK